MEGDKGSVAEGERERGVLYEYVRTCKWWNLCIFQSLLERHNMPSMRCLNSVSSMEVPLHTCMCMCIYVYVYICMRVSCLNTQRQYLRPTQEVDPDSDKYVRNLCAELWSPYAC